jgi:hypothetical protein
LCNAIDAHEIAELFQRIGQVFQELKIEEILYIFFGIHAANVVLLAERLQERQQVEAA